MRLESKGKKVRLFGNLTYKVIKEFDRYAKKETFNEIDLSGAELLDTSFIIYLLKTNKKLAVSEKQKQLIDIVKKNLKDRPIKIKKTGFFYDIGFLTISKLKHLYHFLVFLGEVFIKGLDLILKPKRLRFKMIAKDIELMGFNAIPILATISFLIGAVIAYHGAIRLKQFGANIFVVDLVSVSVLRELGPLIVAILLAGRSSSSYTTQIGIMKITEEIDVIKTMGIEPFDVLVFPKIVSMLISVPLLIILADISGVLGGIIVAKLSLGVTLRDFILRLHHAIDIKTFLAGILKAPAFAFLIATIGSFEGFMTQKNVESIGESVTDSVVNSIFAVIIADAIFSILFRWLGI